MRLHSSPTKKNEGSRAGRVADYDTCCHEEKNKTTKKASTLLTKKISWKMYGSPLVVFLAVSTFERVTQVGAFLGRQLPRPSPTRVLPSGRRPFSLTTISQDTLQDPADVEATVSKSYRITAGLDPEWFDRFVLSPLGRTEVIDDETVARIRTEATANAAQIRREIQEAMQSQTEKAKVVAVESNKEDFDEEVVRMDHITSEETGANVVSLENATRISLEEEGATNSTSRITLASSGSSKVTLAAAPHNSSAVQISWTENVTDATRAPAISSVSRKEKAEDSTPSRDLELSMEMNAILEAKLNSTTTAVAAPDEMKEVTTSAPERTTLESNVEQNVTLNLQQNSSTADVALSEDVKGASKEVNVRTGGPKAERTASKEIVRNPKDPSPGLSGPATSSQRDLKSLVSGVQKVAEGSSDSDAPVAVDQVDTVASIGSDELLKDTMVDSTPIATDKRVSEAKLEDQRVSDDKSEIDPASEPVVDDRLIMYKGPLSKAWKQVGLQKLLDLGYTEGEVTSLLPDTLELLALENIRRPSSGIPARWKAKGSSAEMIKIVSLEEATTLTRSKSRNESPEKAESMPFESVPGKQSRDGTATEDEDSNPSSRLERRQKRLQRQDTEDDDKAEVDPSLINEGRRRKRRERVATMEDGSPKPLYSGRPADGAAKKRRKGDPPPPTRFWPDMDSFRNLLRSEADFRLNILGDGWTDVLKDESTWRHDVYSDWLWTLSNGIGSPHVESRSDRSRRMREQQRQEESRDLKKRRQRQKREQM
jgi:hypothetical protein